MKIIYFISYSFRFSGEIFLQNTVVSRKNVMNWDAIKEIQNIIEEDNPGITAVKILYFCEIGG